jgi:hypothetical protein
MNLEIIFIVLIAIPVICFFFRRRLISIRRKKVLQEELQKITRVLKLQPYKKDYFSDKVLVLDITNEKVVYLDYFNFKGVTMIDLQELKECKLLVRSLVVRLDLIFHNPCRQQISIVFYQRFVDSGCLRRKLTTKARTWNGLLMRSIGSNKKFEYGISG